MGDSTGTSAAEARERVGSAARGASPGADSLIVTRRAIFGRDLSVWGYELTCRGGRAGVPESTDRLSSEVSLLNALAELGVKQLVAEKVALIAIGIDTMLGRIPLPGSGEATVLDLRLEGDEVDDALIAAVDERLDEGFRLALSGELWARGAAPLLERAALIRVPFEQLDTGVLDRLPVRPRTQQLWIDRVDRPEDFPLTRKHGPHYFSGDFLLKPSPVSGKRAPRNLTVLMELMTKLRQPDIGFTEIESILRRDAGLSVTLLRFLNSAGFGLRVQVSNIRQAVALIGLSEFSKWVTLVGLGAASQKPNEVLITALVRAKTCELVANAGNDGALGGTAFMVGLFSLLDAMMDQPLEEVLEDLPVSDVLRAALLYQAGTEGEILAAVLDYERGLPPETLPFETADIFESWQHAVRWADSLRGSLPQSAPPRSRRRG
jgi:EAL and modified HD-GYP domain-containing signal transduction protein